jgi:predicted AAA+ superfamily ATPase
MNIGSITPNFHGIMLRQTFLNKILKTFKVTPIVAILGPRQCGKTTTAHQYISSQSSFSKENYFDLENYRDLERLKDPLLTLSQLNGLIVIDEIQKVPDLFQTLRVLIDNKNLNQHYLILGSASRDLISQSSETLAGRISYLELTPFSLHEIDLSEQLWIRGGFPLSFLAENDEISIAWRKSYIKTFLERDIPELGIKIPPEQIRRFWMMLTHYHGGIFNASEIGRSLGFSHKTMKEYADILSATFMIRQLQPWFENICKRQVKTPKIYMRDSGIFHTLMGINSRGDLLIHPKLGASWEGFALEQCILHLDAEQEECYFWSTYQQAELDLLIIKDGKRLGFELKYSAAPKLTKSMQIALESLHLDSLTVVYPGDIDYPLTKQIQVKSLKSFQT